MSNVIRLILKRLLGLVMYGPRSMWKDLLESTLVIQFQDYGSRIVELGGTVRILDIYLWKMCIIYIYICKPYTLISKNFLHQNRLMF